MPKLKQTRTDWKWRHCQRKVTFRTLDQAEADVALRKDQVIYNRLEPQAYPCDYGSHYHVGHALKRR